MATLLFCKLGSVAIALIVVDAPTVIGPVYWFDDAVGVDPSVV